MAEVAGGVSHAGFLTVTATGTKIKIPSTWAKHILWGNHMVSGGVINPTDFIPMQDQGYLLVNVQLPDSASVQRTQAVMQKINRIVLGDDTGALLAAGATAEVVVRYAAAGDVVRAGELGQRAHRVVPDVDTLTGRVERERVVHSDEEVARDVGEVAAVAEPGTGR